MSPAATYSTPADLLAKLDADIADGRTVWVSTAYRHTVFSPETVAKVRARGAEPFRIAADGTLAMLDGWSKGRPRYVTISLSNGRLLVGVRSV